MGCLREALSGLDQLGHDRHIGAAPSPATDAVSLCSAYAEAGFPHRTLTPSGGLFPTRRKSPVDLDHAVTRRRVTGSRVVGCLAGGVGMADLIFLALGGGAFVAFAVLAAVLKRV